MLRLVPAVACSALVAASVAGLLVAEKRRNRPLKWACKPLASTGFVLLGVSAGGAATPVGRILLVALALGWVGDVLLLGRGTLPFALGLGSFLLGHAAFGVGFVARGVSWPATAAAWLLLAGPFALLWGWLAPSVPRPLRAPVIAYFAVISAMVALAAGAAWDDGSAGSIVIPAAALMFAASDVSVARDRFKSAGWTNRAWGLPVYYAAQCLLAAAIALPRPPSGDRPSIAPAPAPAPAATSHAGTTSRAAESATFACPPREGRAPACCKESGACDLDLGVAICGPMGWTCPAGGDVSFEGCDLCPGSAPKTTN